MKNGKSRFQYHFNKVERLLSEATKQENPALWLYQNDLRTPMFMLESLSKMYAKFHDEEIFDEFKESFKSLEDGLGAIDFYTVYANEFVENDQIPSTIKLFLENKANQKTDYFNELLEIGNWLNGEKITQLNHELDKMDWLEEEKEVEKIEKFYHKQIKKIQEFMDESNMPFVYIEEEIHELRRKVRWLSIYPQALQGAVQLKEIKGTNENLSKYLSGEIINSPFNQLPVSENLKNHLFLEKNHFLALSWLIAELGKIKDTGLKINVLQEALHETNSLNNENALETVYGLLGEDYPKMETLLHQASDVSKRFFEDKILDSLVLGQTV